MKIQIDKLALVMAFLLLYSASTIAGDNLPKFAGTYTSNKTQSEIIILKLNPNKSAIIESWINGVATIESGSWALNENIITVQYKDFVQEYIPKKLSLFEYGSFKRIRGLKPLLTKKYGGFIESVKFVDKVILDELIKSGKIQLKEKPKTGYINYISVIFVTFFISAFIGRKKPVLFAIICMVSIPMIGYLTDELHTSLAKFTLVGFLFSYLWSMLWRWITLKTSVSLDGKLRFITGFSSGGGNRNTTIIGPKGSKRLD